MQANQPVVSLPLAIGFDPRVLQVADISEGGFLRQGGAQTSFTYRVDPGGQVLMTATRSGHGGATAADVVATLNFRAHRAWQLASPADHHRSRRVGWLHDQCQPAGPAHLLTVAP
jgi:hypothetical protein